MNLKELLNEKREQILERWVDLIIQTYPSDASNFLKNKQNRFDNPIGYSISSSVGEIFRFLVDGLDPEAVATPLDSIIKVRAVQEFTPAQAVNFVFLLKQAIRFDLADQIKEANLLEELLEFEYRFDNLISLAFNIYCDCREKLYKIRVDELSRRTDILFAQLNKVKPPEGL